MSNLPSTAERLAFFGMEEAETAAPSPTRARVDAVESSRSAVDPGPSQFHRVHGVFPKRPGQETRVTTTGRTPDGRSSRLYVRTWRANADGIWWPLKNDHGFSVPAEHAHEFARAVAAAVQALEGEVKS
jgi:hypothetical protein